MAAPGAPPPEDNLNLDLITAPAVVPATPDRQSQAELDREEKALRNLGLRQDIGARKKYAFRIFVLVVGWLIGVFGILVAQGFSWRGFRLSENVLLAAIGSTTANIIGILVIIVKYLFADKK